MEKTLCLCLDWIGLDLEMLGEKLDFNQRGFFQSKLIINQLYLLFYNNEEKFILDEWDW